MSFLTNLTGKSLFVVGIKGTLMAPLVCRLAQLGLSIEGSDTSENFATEELLQKALIKWQASFDKDLIPPECSLLIYSAAYQANEQVQEAARRNIEHYSHPEFIAKISQEIASYGVAGTHGKTTAVGALEWLLRPMHLEPLFIYGSHLQGEYTLEAPLEPNMCFIEACEYREHFLLYTLQGALLTTIDWDHPDYYDSKEASLTAFKAFVERLPLGAPLVCEGDSTGNRRLLSWVRRSRGDLKVLSYGVGEANDYRLTLMEGQRYKVTNLRGEFTSPFSSTALTLNVIGSALLVSLILNDRSQLGPLLKRAESFKGCQGRLEPLFEEGEILYINDYAHHPSEIRVSLETLRSSYPGRRIVVIFYPHTVSRTQAFFTQFVEELSRCDLLILRPIASSARADDKGALVLGKKLATALKAPLTQTREATIEYSARALRGGDLCVTMGAGNNYKLAQAIAHYRRSRSE
ncbi:MAG: cyanophycin synthetase [Sphaerochaetaceae bacterium]